MHEIMSEKAITSWDEGLPLGNGDIGCLIWGRSDNLRFSLDKGDIWDVSGQPGDNPQFTYANQVKWAKNGDLKSISDTFEKCYHKPTPTKLPVGAIVINARNSENISSKLDIKNAEVSIKSGNVEIKSFVHSGAKIGYIRANSGSVKIDLDIPKFGGLKVRWWQKLGKAGITQSLKNLHYKPYEYCEMAEGGVEFKYFVQTVNDEFNYGVVVGVMRTATSTDIAYTIMSTHDGENYLEKAKKIIADGLKIGYTKAVAEHAKWWTEFWGKSSISIPNQAIEKGWYIGNYLLGSASRKGHYPMPLQGLWTADNGELPPWKGDYHHDLNTQLTYFSYTKANHIEEGECFIDYLLGLASVGEKFSRDFYGVEGLSLPSVMDINGGALGGWAMYSLSPTNMLWLCDIIAKHYEYSPNAEFLAKIYPYFCGVEKTIRQLLTEKNGKLYLALSSSPEIHDNTQKAYVEPNSNYDLALMIKFYKSIIRYSTILGKATDEYALTLSKLDKLAVADDGVLMLNRVERLEESHRHHSHAMSIFPLRLIDYDNLEQKRIIDATIADMERLGSKWWTGYSLAWCAEFYAVQRNGDKASDMIEKFFKYFCLPNGFHINGDYTKQGLSSFTYRPFTLEGNFCANDAVQEMLLYSHDGIIEPLRAVPKEWNNIAFDNLRAEGGVLVSLKYENNELINLEFAATNDIVFKLKTNYMQNFDLSGYESDGDKIVIHMLKGNSINFMLN